MVTLLAEQIVNESLCHAGRVYQYPPTPPPQKNFIADLHESQDPSFLKKTAEFPRIRGESSCLSIHTVPVTSDRTSVFSGHPSQNYVPKLTYFKTQSYLVLSLALQC